MNHNYGEIYPMECCNTCNHLYLSSYGTPQCLEQPSGSEVALVGTCEHWVHRPTQVAIRYEE